MKQAGVRGLTFPELIEGGRHYVDKTLLIKDILDNNDRGVYLFTRPHGFGKSTNLSMLDAFFNIDYRGNRWFDSTEISKHPGYGRYRNGFPVVRLDLEDVHDGNPPDYGTFLRRMRDALSRTFSGFRYLLDSNRIPDDLKDRFRSASDSSMNEYYMGGSLSLLCRMLEAHHGRKAVMLIDEYDRPVMESFGSVDQTRVASFMEGLLSSTLKGNRSLQMACVTGTMPVTRDGMPLGPNNMWVDDVFSTHSDERFGFTEAEVSDILRHHGCSYRLEEVREWFGGYRFGDSELYNPLGVTMYVSGGSEPQDFPIGVAVAPLGWVLDKVDARVSEEVTGLVSGGEATVDLRPDLDLDGLGNIDREGLFTLLVSTGCLRAVPCGGNGYRVSLPNRGASSTLEGLVRGPRRRIRTGRRSCCRL